MAGQELATIPLPQLPGLSDQKHVPPSPNNSSSLDTIYVFNLRDSNRTNSPKQTVLACFDTNLKFKYPPGHNYCCRTHMLAPVGLSNLFRVRKVLLYSPEVGWK